MPLEVASYATNPAQNHKPVVSVPAMNISTGFRL